MDERHLKELEIIKKLLIVSLLKSGVSPEIVSKVTGVASKTIQNQFPVKLIAPRQK